MSPDGRFAAEKCCAPVDAFERVLSVYRLRAQVEGRSGRCERWRSNDVDSARSGSLILQEAGIGAFIRSSSCRAICRVWLPG